MNFGFFSKYKLSHKFWTWFLYSSKLISQKELPEYKNMSFLFSSKGLSQSSINTFSKSRIISSNSNIARYKESIISNITIPDFHIIWIDNYSKFYKNATISIKSSGFQTANWTAIGCIKIKYPFSILIPINYDSIMKSEIVNTNIIFQRKGLYNYDYYSFCRNAFINTFPLKHPNSDNLYYNLTDFYPLKILSHNIGSDIGFKNVYDYIINNYSLNNTMTPIILDINIYWRFYKWIYNPHNDCSLLINKFIPVLGFWHNYKELCLIIWKKGLQSFFGLLFHSLWSESSILFKPKLEILNFSLHLYLYLMMNSEVILIH